DPGGRHRRAVGFDHDVVQPSATGSLRPECAISSRGSSRPSVSLSRRRDFAGWQLVDDAVADAELVDRLVGCDYPGRASMTRLRRLVWPLAIAAIVLAFR